MSMSEIEKTCENCEYELEDMEGMHCRHCIHNAEEHFMQKEIHYTEQEIRNKAIDELANKLCEHCMQQTNECYKLECPFCTDGCDIINIVEQMKGV